MSVKRMVIGVFVGSLGLFAFGQQGAAQPDSDKPGMPEPLPAEEAAKEAQQAGEAADQAAQEADQAGEAAQQAAEEAEQAGEAAQEAATEPAPAEPAPAEPAQTEPLENGNGAYENGNGAAQGKPLGQRSETTTTMATVQSVDKKDRTVTLRGDDGEETTVSVPKDVTGFERLKKGDMVNISYYESIAVSLLPPGAKPSMREKETMSRAQGSGAMGRQVTASAEITKIDTEDNEVTFKGPQGKARTVKVQDPDMQEQLKTLKPGDVIRLTYTEATAASLETAQKEGN